MPGYRYVLRDRDGNDAGMTEIAHVTKVEDELILAGNRRATVTAIIPTELVGEFVDGALFGVLEIAPG